MIRGDPLPARRLRRSSTAIAALLGAANLGTAATFGQIAFAAALVYVLLKR